MQGRSGEDLEAANGQMNYWHNENSPQPSTHKSSIDQSVFQSYPLCGYCALPPVDLVRKELRKIKVGKPGPDGISSRLFKDCADQLCKVAMHVPVLWKISCAVPVPEAVQLRVPNHFRP